MLRLSWYFDTLFHFFGSFDSCTRLHRCRISSRKPGARQPLAIATCWMLCRLKFINVLPSSSDHQMTLTSFWRSWTSTKTISKAKNRPSAWNCYASWWRCAKCFTAIFVVISICVHRWCCLQLCTCSNSVLLLQTVSPLITCCQRVWHRA